MAIDTSGEWWVGSEPGDIEEYLAAYSRDEETVGYEVTAYRAIVWECGSDRFRLVSAGEEVQRRCDGCGREHLICGEPEDWEEASHEEECETLACVECGGQSVNAGVGFALYPEHDGVKWLYVGYRCAACGVLGCVVDRKVGYGPAEEVFAGV